MKRPRPPVTNAHGSRVVYVAEYFLELRASTEKFAGGQRKIAKKTEIALSTLFQRGDNEKKDRKIAKNTEK